MKLFDCDLEKGVELVRKINSKFKPAFDKLPLNEQAAAALYFLPHKSSKETLSVTRPRVIKWYCPFADQNDFPSGIRYCINVYTGCHHKCRYCYAQGYEPDQPKCKEDYKIKLLKDLSEIKDFDLPPAPVHLSNSTDPLQPLELDHRLTLYTLKQLLSYRNYFTSIVILTKNPAILLEHRYISILKELAELPENHLSKNFFKKHSIPALRIETSLAFATQCDADFYDPGAPPITDRINAIKQLRQKGIDVVLRIDPLLPRNPLLNNTRLEDYDLPDAQSLSKLEKLVSFASNYKLIHIVYSVAKIVSSRHRTMPQAMIQLKKVYEHINTPMNLTFKGGSWRLSNLIAKNQIIDQFLEVCDKHNMKAYYCKQNLLLTP